MHGPSAGLARAPAPRAPGAGPGRHEDAVEFFEFVVELRLTADDSFIADQDGER
jgi:hypothetical protein